MSRLATPPRRTESAYPTPTIAPGQDLRYSPHTDIGEYIARKSGNGDAVVLLSEAGVIPFLTKGPVVDYLGVVTRADRHWSVTLVENRVASRRA